MNEPAYVPVDPDDEPDTPDETPEPEPQGEEEDAPIAE